MKIYPWACKDGCGTRVSKAGVACRPCANRRTARIRIDPRLRCPTCGRYWRNGKCPARAPDA